MKSVKEVMVTTPKFCNKNQTLQAVVEQMSKTNVGYFPVVDENKKLVGFITGRDICTTAGTQSNTTLADLTVEDVITNKQVYVCSATDNIATALKIMRTYKVGRLPVIDTNKNLQGLVTLTDILRTTAANNNAEATEIEFKGEENIIKTLRSIATRDGATTR